MRLPRPALPVLALALAAAPLAAQERVVIYRCVAADGTVIVQNDRPCPAGTTQQDRRVMQAPQPVAAPADDGTPTGLIQSAPPPGVPPAAGRAGVVAPGTGGGIPPAPGAPGIPPAPQAGALPVPAAAPGTLIASPQRAIAPAPSALATVPGVAPTEDAAPPPLYECRTFTGAVYLGEDPEPPPRCAALETTGVGAAPAAGSACEVVRDACAPVPAAALCERWRDRLRTMEAALTFGRLDERETARVEIDRVRSIVEDSACGL